MSTFLQKSVSFLNIYFLPLKYKTILSEKWEMFLNVSVNSTHQSYDRFSQRASLCHQKRTFVLT